MKVFLIFLVKVLLIYTLFNVLYLFVLSKVDWDFNKTIVARKFKGEDFDFLIFGNSTAMDGINSEIIAKELGDAYNFSLGGATLKDNFDQLSFYLENNQIPTQVWLFLSSCHNNYTNASYNSPIVEFVYRKKDIHSKWIGLDQIPIYRFRWLFIENLKKLISKDHRNTKVVKGQLRINRTVGDPTKIPQNNNCIDKDQYQSSGYNYMYNIIRLCKESNIDLKIFEMPCWRRFQNNCQQTTASIQGSDNELIHIQNLNEDSLAKQFIDSDSHWLSKNHLNAKGSIELTRFIIREFVGAEPKY